MWYFELDNSNQIGMFNVIGASHYRFSEEMTQLPLNYNLTSKHFNDKTNSDDVIQIGKFILVLVRGYSILTDNDFKGFETSLKCPFGNENLKHIEAVSLNLERIDELLDQTVCDEDINGAINRGFKTGFFRDILVHASSGWNFSTISKINDELIYITKVMRRKDNEFRSDKDFGRFSAVANNKAIGGYNSRHGTKYGGGENYSKEIMTLEEASLYIRNYLNNITWKFFKYKFPILLNRNDDSNITLF